MRVRVVVTTDTRRERVSKITDTEFHIETRERALQNKANVRVRELIAFEFQVPVAKVWLLTGHRSRVKIVDVDV
jgi:uncharacterized protein YggU (UPF0235/DUF167 family)